MLTVDYGRLGLRPGERVLDLGCGGGRHAFEAARRGARVVALDAGAEEVAQVRAMAYAMAEAGELAEGGSVVAVRGDARALPFPSGSFDRVVAAEVLEHIPEDQRAIGELARVLKPGGVLAVTVPRFGPEALNWLLSREYHDVPGGHVRIYRRGQLAARLCLGGLRPVERHHAHGLHSPYWWLKCLVGVGRDDHPLVQAYHRLLVKDIVEGPRWTRAADRLLSPLWGKSLVVYAVKLA